MLMKDKKGFYIPCRNSIGVQYLSSEEVVKVKKWTKEAKENNWDIEQYIYFNLYGE